MPLSQLFTPTCHTQGIKHHVPGFEAWRWAFFVPGGIFLLVGIVTLLSGQDAPDGDYRDLKASGKMAKSGNAWTTLKCAFTNYRAWVLLLTYGYSFGVELTVDDMIVQYLYDQFELNLATAGGLGAMFGLMNIFSRASGGMISDLVAARFGMRGRLWALYIIQTCGGLFCIGMGLTDYTLGGTLACMVVFSIFCQQACGAHFGIAPFISRRAYGVVRGVGCMILFVCGLQVLTTVNAQVEAGAIDGFSPKRTVQRTVLVLYVKCYVQSGGWDGHPCIHQLFSNSSETCCPLV